jgi:hypothetical protein
LLLTQHSVFAFTLCFDFLTVLPAKTAVEVAKASKAMIAPFFIV